MLTFPCFNDVLLHFYMSLQDFRFSVRLDSFPFHTLVPQIAELPEIRTIPGSFRCGGNSCQLIPSLVLHESPLPVCSASLGKRHGATSLFCFFVTKPHSDTEETSSRLHLHWVVFFFFNVELRETTAFESLIQFQKSPVMR